MSDITKQDRSRRTVLKQTGGLATVGTVGALSGCLGFGGGGGAGGGGKEVTLVTQDTHQVLKRANDQMAQEFNEETGHTVTFEYAPGGEITDRLASMIRGGNPPEVAMGIPAPVTGPLLQDDQLETATDLFEELKDTRVGQIQRNVTPISDGEVMAIPYAIKPWACTIHGHLLEEAGAPIPETTEERIDVGYDDIATWSQAISQETDADGFAWSFASNTKGGYDCIHLLMSNGVQMFHGEAPDDITLELDGKHRSQAVEAIEFWVNEMIPPAPDGSSLSWADVNTGVANGHFGGGYYTQGSVSAAINDGAGQEEWIDTLLPINNPMEQQRPDGNRNWAAPPSFHFLKGAENTDVARDFVKHFFTSEQFFDYVNSRPLHLLPPSKELLQADEYRNNWLAQRRPDALEFVDALFEEGSLFTPEVALGGFNSAYSATYTNAICATMIQRVVLEDMDPEDAVDQAASEIREFL